jgi:tRNA(Ser,Leu) C12 N-acetylase TAN1
MHACKHEFDRRLSGIVNVLRLKSKRDYTRALCLQKSFKYIDRIYIGSIPVKSWIDYYKSEFSSPGPFAESKFEK